MGGLADPPMRRRGQVGYRSRSRGASSSVSQRRSPAGVQELLLLFFSFFNHPPSLLPARESHAHFRSSRRFCPNRTKTEPNEDDAQRASLTSAIMMSMNSKQPFSMHPILHEPKYTPLHSSSEAIRRACLPTPSVSPHHPDSFRSRHHPKPNFKSIRVSLYSLEIKN